MLFHAKQNSREQESSNGSSLCHGSNYVTVAAPNNPSLLPIFIYITLTLHHNTTQHNTSTLCLSLRILGLSQCVAMTAEVTAQEETQQRASEVPAEEPRKNVAAAKEEEEEKVLEVEESKAETMGKSSSYREESNFLSDLKEFERKALNELKAKLEEALLGHNLFDEKTEESKKMNEVTEEDNKKEEEVKKQGADEEGEEPVKEQEEKKSEEEEKSVEVEKDVSLWGVPILPSKGDEGTDVVLLKFLRAREFKVSDAFEMLKKTLKWRKESSIDSVVDEDFGPGLGSAACMSGVDREGHPVCYNIYGVFDNEELYQKSFGSEEKRIEFLRWRCQMMEKGIQKLNFKPGGVTSLLQVNDLKNSPGPSKKELRIAVKQVVSLLQDNYPELVAKHIFINVPFWYYAVSALLSPFLTQRTKRKFVVARPAKVTETLIKYIPIEEIPVQYGGFKREDDTEFCSEDGAVSELTLKAASTATIEIPTLEVGNTLCWDVTVLGWEVSYKEEFVPSDEGSYTIIVQKGKKMGSQEGPVRNTFRNNEAGKVVLTIDNTSNKKKRVWYRYKTIKNTF
ncbi:hypothetical protein Ahy_Scaffold6g107929 isoform A [Arachis hypogaea]|uniref:CRAL-TRIO domain-containing protein n=2 Tax=Arachis hypogaea TaxID=3818 RepID=A0A444WPQ8_ARAHY|nr:hypothetical protein Ahy_Scaffold6g107929 isoform A [Arachis hypogaea]